MIIKLYVVFIGILIALFVGVGVAAFYPGPKAPEYPIERTAPTEEGQPNEAQQAEITAFEKASRDHQQLQEDYNRNVSIIVLIAAVILLAVSLTLFKSSLMMADGLLLGGVLTLIYSIIRGFGSGDDLFRFLVVAAGLAAALILGYVKFVRPSQELKKKASR